MPVHQRVRAWIAQNYQKPTIDEEWLADCSGWVSSELGLDPIGDFDQFIQHVEAQLLQSNLADSTVPGSGIDPLLVMSNPGPARPRSTIRRPVPQPPRQKKTTGATPLLVEIKSITDIAHSAFSLLNTHQTRLDRADLGLAQDENAEQQRDADEGPVPRFPRGMLKFELSDGSTTFTAIEFRSLPELELGTTPLGYKMFLRSTPIRNGIAFLEPSNVVLKGYRTEDHDVNREQVFLSLLRKRLGRPDPPPEEQPAPAQPQVNPPEPTQARLAHQNQPPPIARPPSPPPDIDNMYVDDDVDPDVLREMAMQMDEEIDRQENRRPGIQALQTAGPPPTSKVKLATNPNPVQSLRTNTTIASSSCRASSASSAKTSSYFTAHSSGTKPIPDIGLSPRPAPPPELDCEFDITWDVDDPEPSHLSIKKFGSTSVRPHFRPNKQPPSPDPYDDLSFDMEVDDSFLEQVGMIEQGALAVGANSKGKGKAKDARPEGHLNVVAARKAPSGSAAGTKHSATCSVSSSGAEPSTRVQSNTNRATSTSSLSGPTESPMPQSTQSSDRRLPRDPSLIVISSSEDEASGSYSSAKPPNLVRGRASKKRKMDQDVFVDSDVIDISD